MSKDDYEVGYGKPPKHSQFKPGQSGNPGGLKKQGTLSIAELFVNEGNRRLKVRVDGKMVSITQGEIAAKQLYDKAMKTVTRAFDTVQKLEAQYMKARWQLERSTTCNPTDPHFGVLLVRQGRPWASHCEQCGKPLYDAIDGWREVHEAQGYVMTPIRYNGPETAEEIEKFGNYRAEVANAERERSNQDAPASNGGGKKSRRRSNLGFAELVVKEGNRRRRVPLDGKIVTLTQRQIAAKQQYRKAVATGDQKTIDLIEKYEAQIARFSRPLEPAKRTLEALPVEVTLDFEEPPPVSLCEECLRDLDDFIAQMY